MNARVKLILLWALFALALIAAIVFAVLWLQSVNDANEAQDVEDTASEVALALTNFSADTIDQDVAEINQYAVGEFAEEVGVFFGDEAVDAIEEAEGESEAELDSIFVEEVEGDNASAFAVLTQSVSNTGLAEARTDTIRMELGMVRTPNGWKANEVDILQSPGVTIPGGLGS